MEDDYYHRDVFLRVFDANSGSTMIGGHGVRLGVQALHIPTRKLIRVSTHSNVYLNQVEALKQMDAYITQLREGEQNADRQLEVETPVSESR